VNVGVGGTGEGVKVGRGIAVSVGIDDCEGLQEISHKKRIKEIKHLLIYTSFK